MIDGCLNQQVPISSHALLGGWFTHSSEQAMADWPCGPRTSEATGAGI